MSFSSYPLSALPRELRQRVDEFQSYVVERYLRRAAKWGLARELIQHLADKIHELSLPAKPAVDPIRIARLFGIAVEFHGKQSDRVCGRLVPTVGGFQATVVGDPENSRTRFTIGHECGHVLFYGPGPDIPLRIIPPTPARTGEADREEWLCNEFSRALLVPSKWKDDVLVSSTQVPSVLAFATALKVSPEVLIRRVIYDWRGWQSSVFYYVHSTRNTCDVRVFRGADRSTPSEAAPSSGTIQDLWAKHGRAEFRHRLKDQYGVSDADVVETQSTLWWSTTDTSKADNRSSRRSFSFPS